MSSAFLQTWSIDTEAFDDVIDVRSPAEFAEDHIPGAINLPAFSDVERAEVGTTYVQDSRFKARKRGAALLARNVARHIETALDNRGPDWRPLVYCWRGGQRSGAVATVLRQIGWQVETVPGGYKTYRRAVMSALYQEPLPYRLILLDGYTGTAKTDLLHLLADRGHQTVDLEGLARHRGSIFGGLDGGQPAQKMFESRLCHVLAPFDPSRAVITEAESSKIGERNIPPSFWAAMTDAPRIVVRASLKARVAYTLRRYPEMTRDRDALRDGLDRLVMYHGHKRVDAWQGMARVGDFAALVAELMTHHYDPRYLKSRARHDDNNQIDTGDEVEALDDASLEGLADRVEQALARL